MGTFNADNRCKSFFKCILKITTETKMLFIFTYKANRTCINLLKYEAGTAVIITLLIIITSQMA